MTGTSTTAWVYVDHRHDRTRPTGAGTRANNALESVSPEELAQQQKLLDHYRRKRREAERNNDEQPAPSQPTSASPQPRPRRTLKPSPSSILEKVTWASTTRFSEVILSKPVVDEPFSPSLPPIPAEARRKPAASHVPPSTGPRAPPRSKTGPANQQAAAGSSNVATTSTAGPSLPTPQIPRYRSFPVLQAPLQLPLQSLPPGYDFALRAHFRPEAAALRPLRLLSLGTLCCVEWMFEYEANPGLSTVRWWRCKGNQQSTNSQSYHGPHSTGSKAM
ncbi:hypothetical protein BDV93DRAFT_109605 [Ceratobasidium sp. AG-I]|nr:hypothetical protein BDV93DRAFT_109605 [Ceratobasidium sp. AG-I]